MIMNWTDCYKSHKRAICRRHLINEMVWMNSTPSEEGRAVIGLKWEVLMCTTTLTKRWYQWNNGNDIICRFCWCHAAGIWTPKTRFNFPNLLPWQTQCIIPGNWTHYFQSDTRPARKYIRVSGTIEATMEMEMETSLITKYSILSQCLCSWEENFFRMQN